MNRTLDILYRDELVAVVDKPSGLSVHRGWERGDDFAMTRLKRQLGRWVWPIHRLDRATSGVLVFALDEGAARSLHLAFQEGAVAKTYLAWTRGVPSPPSGTIDHPVPRDEGGERVDAVTDYEVLDAGISPLTGAPRYARVIARPRTGRLHQIRRHLRHLHCPLLGDTTYGDARENKLLREHTGLSRLALHALALRVPHPEGGVLEIHAALPDDLRTPFRALGLEDGALGEHGAPSFARRV